MIENETEKEAPKRSQGWATITYALIIFTLGFFIGHSIPNYDADLNINSLAQYIVRPTPTLTPTPTLSPAICKRITYPTAGRSPTKDKFLNVYTTVQGDTLLSISKKQLGDVSRVNELLNLNKSQYPTLTQSSIIPAGSKLYVTPKDFPENTGDLWIAEGPVIESDLGHFVLMISTNPNDGGEDIDTNSTTKYMNGITSIKRGDCISVVIDYMGNDSHNALVIWPQ